MDATGRARITDFGVATAIQDLDSLRSASGYQGHNVRWAAPEILEQGTYSREADIFSFAMVMIEVRCGPPYARRTWHRFQRRCFLVRFRLAILIL